jgi:hypothetical protein
MTLNKLKNLNYVKSCHVSFYRNTSMLTSVDSQVTLVLVKHGKSATAVLTSIVVDLLLYGQFWMGGHQMNLVPLHRPTFVFTGLAINGVFSVRVAVFL